MELSNYLNGHLAAETQGVELARWSATEREGTRLGTFLEMLGWELEIDRATLVALMDELGAGRHLTTLRATVAEKLRQRRLRGSGAASTLATLDSLDLGIEEKLAMWTALRAILGGRVDDVDFDVQIRRAELQHELLGRRRLGVAA